MDPNAPTKPDGARRIRSANLRTALVFASIAAVFFAGIIATKWMGGPTVGIGVMGAAVLVFLVFAIGRNMRK
jgi:hypothetical protein